MNTIINLKEEVSDATIELKLALKERRDMGILGKLIDSKVSSRKAILADAEYRYNAEVEKAFPAGDIENNKPTSFMQEVLILMVINSLINIATGSSHAAQDLSKSTGFVNFQSGRL